MRKGTCHVLTDAEVHEAQRMLTDHDGSVEQAATEVSIHFGISRHTVYRIHRGEIVRGYDHAADGLYLMRGGKGAACHDDYMHHPIDEPVPNS